LIELGGHRRPQRGRARHLGAGGGHWSGWCGSSGPV